MTLYYYYIPKGYHDFSKKDQEWVEKHINHRQNNGSIPKQSRKGAKSSFPKYLYYMLENAESAGYSSIVSFQPHGRSFKIHDRKLFSNQVLPHYFPGQKKITSFFRQLNIYGFLRMIKVGPDQDSYYHQFFLRGRSEMCCLIQRNPIALTFARQTYNPSTEPDFYKMLPVMVTDPNLTSNNAIFFDSVITSNRDDSYNIGLMMKPDPNQMMKPDPNQSTSGVEIGSKATIEDNQKPAPTQNHYDNWDIEPMPITYALPGINTCATTNQDLNYHPFYLRQQPMLGSNLDRNLTSYSFPSQVLQPIVKIPVQCSMDMTGNETEMDCDNPYKIQSMLGLPNDSSTTGNHLHKIEPTQRIDDAMPLIASSVGLPHTSNAQSISKEDVSNSIDVLSSIRIFDVNFVHEQQRQQYDRIATNSQTMNDHDESSHTSGSRMVRFLEDVDLESD
jgi:hypothetical protein